MFLSEYVLALYGSPTIYYDNPRYGECITNEDCNDYNYCTEDLCVDNYCQNIPITCDDGVGCTADSCNPMIGCVYSPNDGYCPSDTDCADYYCDINEDCQVNYESPTTICRDSAGVCDIIETCTGTSPDCPSDSKSTALCRASTGQCDIAEYCDGINNNCPSDSKSPFGTSCNDGLWCSAEDQCDGNGNCIQKTARDCSVNDITGIAECFYVPDAIDFTWDYRDSFTSVCDEDNDLCNLGDTTITHTCADDDLGDTVPLGGCDAECDEDSDCQSGVCLGDCTCSAVAIPTVTIHFPESNNYATKVWLNVTAEPTPVTWWYNLNGGGNITFTPNIMINETDGVVYCKNNLTVYASLGGQEGFAEKQFNALKGDADKNGQVNIFDIVICAGRYGSSPADIKECDFDFDDDTDIFDIVAIAGNYGKHC